MDASRLSILQISTRDVGGGAEAVALNLHRAYRARGHGATLLVGERTTQIEGVQRLRNGVGLHGWRGWWWGLDDALAERPLAFTHPVRRVARLLADPGRWLDMRQGREAFRYPGAWRVAEVLGGSPDVIHAHNLHGAYFDLQALAELSRERPAIVTLHDSWLMTGHCAYTLGCENWRTGCGRCPDLSIYPAIRRDNTAENWAIKRDIYSRSRLYLVGPSRWVMDQVPASLLALAARQVRVIPYGVDLSLFRPGSQVEARRALGLPPEAGVLLFAGNLSRPSLFKDLATLRAAVALAADGDGGRPLVFVALGGSALLERLGQAEVRHVPFRRDPREVARYYQAADLYVHAARADTFPNAVLEALACGTPVVATAVGGIPEQVDDGVTGLLVPPGDAEAMAAAIGRLLADDELRGAMGRRAADEARRRFALERQVDDYLSYYAAAIADFGEWRQGARRA
jgi:glycosyltransferase involved in cell wall biosynthesis